MIYFPVLTCVFGRGFLESASLFLFLFFLKKYLKYCQNVSETIFKTIFKKFLVKS